MPIDPYVELGAEAALEFAELDDRLLTKLRSEDQGPYLLFDLARVREAAEALARIGREEGLTFAATVKSLPFPSLLDSVEGLRTFAASNEAELARFADWRNDRTLAPADHVFLAGPAIGGHRGRRTVVCERLVVNIESEAQVQLLDELAPWARNICLGLRISGPSNSPISTVPSRFGFSSSDKEILSRLVKHPKFAGFHCHVEGDADVAHDHAVTLEHLLTVARDVDAPLRLLDLGGGFRRETGAAIRAVSRRLRAMVPGNVELILEPGAWLTSRAGFGLTKVKTVLERPDLGATVVTVDLSRDLHARWSPLSLLKWWGGAPRTRKFRVFGPTAHEGDYLGEFEWTGPLGSSRPASNGWLLFGGITGYSAAFNGAFNGVGPAKVVMVGDNGGT